MQGRRPRLTACLHLLTCFLSIVSKKYVSSTPTRPAFLMIGQNVRYLHRTNHDNHYRFYSSNLAAPVEIDDVMVNTKETIDKVKVDNRPHGARATKSRTARRMNHAFKYLYRHDDTSKDGGMSLNNTSNLTSLEFLVHYGGYNKDQVIEMNRSFPPLLDLNVQRHLRPKMRFLQETICEGLECINEGKSYSTLSEHVRKSIPPQYFGARLERTIAPRHAFLMYHDLPHGHELLQDGDKDGKTLWEDFLVSCRKTKQFCALCNNWKTKYISQQEENHENGGTSSSTINVDKRRITAKEIEAFDFLFQRGLMSCSRNELVQPGNKWPLEHINITAGELINLLVKNGANPLERDVRGVSLLHWSAGTGNVDTLKTLLPYFSSGGSGVHTVAERDGSTILHWAAAGASANEFGCGGHIDVCRYIIEQVENSANSTTKTYVNSLTKDGNSILMWAAWSGALDVVKLLIRNRADPTVVNRNGCSVAHWAASGGNVEVCKYLYETIGVDFLEPNYGGNTPLTHAVAFGRVSVIDWLRRDVCSKNNNNDDGDTIAAKLAKDFVLWDSGGIDDSKKRKEVLSLFEDWYGQDDNDDGDGGDDEDDEFGYL